MRLTFGIQLLLGLLIAVGPLSTDVYIPAFPAIEAEFRSGLGSAQITLAAWFLGLGLGQISMGSLADRFGRRKPLVLANLLYVFASMGCALAPSLWSLAGFRVLAAFTGAAGMVIPRAMVRDVSSGNDAARLLSRLMLVMGVAPIVAPTLGGLITEVASWRMIFWFSVLYGLVGTGFSWALLPDTLAPERRVALRPADMLRRFGAILRDRLFIASALTGGSASFTMFVFLSASPAIFIDRFGFSPAQYGMLFGATAGSFILASQVNARLLARFGLHRLLRIAATGMPVAALALLVAAALLPASPLLLLPPVLVISLCNGFIGPDSTAAALTRHAAHAGSASALFGTINFSMAGVAALLTGALADGTLRPIVLLLAAGSVSALVCDRMRVG